MNYKFSYLKPASCAAISLQIGVAVWLTILVAIGLYNTPTVYRLLIQTDIGVALFTSLVFLIYVGIILITSWVGVALSIISLIRKENQYFVAALGLMLNGSILILMAIKFF